MNNILQETNPEGSSDPTTTTFQDAAPAETAGQKLMNFWPRVGPTDDGIEKFLSRPVRIVTASVLTPMQLYPLRDFMLNPAVARKIANYKYLRATVCIRYVEATNPFVYGCRQISAIPMCVDVNTRYGNIYARSHLSNIYTNPAVTSSYEMRLPYVFPHPYMRIVGDANQTTSWCVTIDNVSTYQRSDSATAPDATCGVYVWLEDVILDVATPTDVVYQSEYTGVISQPASIVSSAAATLSKIPILQPLTRPVEHASSMLASFAKSLGFSKPIQLEPPAPYFNNPDQNMSVMTYLDPAQKLTLDPKAQVTVGTGMFDNSAADNLAFSNFYKKEGLISVTTWTTSQAVGSVLFSIPVTPLIATSTSGSSLAFPPCAIPILPFRLWRGGMKYRIRVVCSQYHRGRLRFFWSPNLINTFTEDIWNTLENVVVDITPEGEYVFEINYAHRHHYLHSVVHYPYSHINDDYNNGYLYCRVSQELTAPLSTADAYVMVSASACDDMIVAGKSNLNMRTFHHFPNNGLVPAAALTRSPLTWPTNNNAADPAVDVDYQSFQSGKTDSHFVFNMKSDSSFIPELSAGQSITSFRELNRAYQLWEVDTLPSQTGNHVSYLSFPPVPWLPGGYLFPQSSAGLRLYDNSLTLCGSIFRFTRGSIRWKIILNGDATGLTFKVELLRAKQPANFRFGGTYNMSAYPSNENALASLSNNAVAFVTSGNSITFEVPYENYRGWYNIPSAGILDQHYNNVLLTVFNPHANTVAPTITYSAYVSAGEDLDFGIPVGYGNSYVYQVFRTPGTGFDPEPPEMIVDPPESEEVLGETTPQQ